MEEGEKVGVNGARSGFWAKRVWKNGYGITGMETCIVDSKLVDGRRGEGWCERSQIGLLYLCIVFVFVFVLLFVIVFEFGMEEGENVGVNEAGSGFWAKQPQRNPLGCQHLPTLYLKTNIWEHRCFGLFRCALTYN